MDPLNHPTPSDVQHCENKSNLQEHLLPCTPQEDGLAILYKKHRDKYGSQPTPDQTSGTCSVGRWFDFGGPVHLCKSKSEL